MIPNENDPASVPPATVGPPAATPGDPHGGVLPGADPTGWPARFHLVPPWMVSIDMEYGLRVYSIGGEDVTDDMLHVRYQSQVGYAHGQGPLEAGHYRMVAAQMLIQYASQLAAGGGIPSGVLQHPAEIGRAHV